MTIAERGKPRGRILAVLLVAAASLAAETALGAPSCAAGDRSCGGQAFAAGTKAFDRAAFAEAIEWFLAARTAEAHPVVGFNLGVCYARLNRPLQARLEFQQVLADPSLDAGLRARVEREQRTAEALLAKISLDAPDPALYPMELDGKPLSAATDSVEVDPGAHRVKVMNGGAVVFDQDVHLEPGERLRLRVTGKASVIDVVVVPGAMRPTPSPTPETSRRPLSPLVFYVSAGATALLGAATIWSGLDVRNAHDAYEQDLPTLTQAEADERVRNGHSRELRTNVLLGTTLAAAGATTLIGVLWVDWVPKRDTALKLELGPTSASLRGVF